MVYYNILLEFSLMMLCIALVMLQPFKKLTSEDKKQTVQGLITAIDEVMLDARENHKLDNVLCDTLENNIKALNRHYGSNIVDGVYWRITSYQLKRYFNNVKGR